MNHDQSSMLRDVLSAMPTDTFLSGCATMWSHEAAALKLSCAAHAVLSRKAHLSLGVKMHAGVFCRRAKPCACKQTAPEKNGNCNSKTWTRGEAALEYAPRQPSEEDEKVVERWSEDVVEGEEAVDIETEEEELQRLEEALAAEEEAILAAEEAALAAEEARLEALEAKAAADATAGKGTVTCN